MGEKSNILNILPYSIKYNSFVIFVSVDSEDNTVLWLCKAHRGLLDKKAVVLSCPTLYIRANIKQRVSLLYVL